MFPAIGGSDYDYWLLGDWQMVMRRSENPNPLLKHLEEYRKFSKPHFRLNREEVKRLAHLQAESFMAHPKIRKKIMRDIQKAIRQGHCWCFSQSRVIAYPISSYPWFILLWRSSRNLEKSQDWCDWFPMIWWRCWPLHFSKDSAIDVWCKCPRSYALVFRSFIFKKNAAFNYARISNTYVLESLVPQATSQNRFY